MERERLTDKQLRELSKDERLLHGFAFPIARCNAKTGERFLEAGNYIVTDKQAAWALKLFNKTRKTILKSLSKGELAFNAIGSPVDNGLDDKVGYYRINTNFTNSKGEVFFIEIDRCFNKPKGFYADIIIDRQKEKEYEKTCKEIHRYNKTIKYPQKKKEFPSMSFYRDREAYNNGKNIESEFTLHNVLNYINEHFGCSYTNVAVHPYMFGINDLLCTC